MDARQSGCQSLDPEQRRRPSGPAGQQASELICRSLWFFLPRSESLSLCYRVRWERSSWDGKLIRPFYPSIWPVNQQVFIIFSRFCTRSGCFCSEAALKLLTTDSISCILRTARHSSFLISLRVVHIMHLFLHYSYITNRKWKHWKSVSFFLHFSTKSLGYYSIFDVSLLPQNLPGELLQPSHQRKNTFAWNVILHTLIPLAFHPFTANFSKYFKRKLISESIQAEHCYLRINSRMLI